MNRRQQQSRFSLVIALALALACLLIYGCASPLKSEAPEGWPELKRTIVQNAPAEQVAEVCGGGYLIAPMACTYANLCEGTCTKYFQKGQDTPENMEHEEGHCQGRDHWFSNLFSSYFERWKKGDVCGVANTKPDEDAANAAFVMFILF